MFGGLHDHDVMTYLGSINNAAETMKSSLEAQIGTLAVQVDTLQKELAASGDTLRMRDSEIESLRNEIARFEEQWQAREQEQRRVTDELAAIHAAALEQRDVDYARQLAQRDKKHERELAEHKAAFAREYEALRRQIDEAQSASVRQAGGASDEAMRTLEHEFSSLLADVQRCRDDLARGVTLQRELASHLETLEHDYGTLQHEADELHRDNDSLRAEQKAAAQQSVALANDNQSLREQNEALAADNDSLTAHVTMLQRQCDAMDAANGSLRRELGEYAARYNEVEQVMNTAREQAVQIMQEAEQKALGAEARANEAIARMRREAESFKADILRMQDTARDIVGTVESRIVRISRIIDSMESRFSVDNIPFIRRVEDESLYEETEFPTLRSVQ